MANFDLLLEIQTLNTKKQRVESDSEELVKHYSSCQEDVQNIDAKLKGLYEGSIKQLVQETEEIKAEIQKIFGEYVKAIEVAIKNKKEREDVAVTAQRAENTVAKSGMSGITSR